MGQRLGPTNRQGRILAFAGRDAGRVDARHLSGTDADGCAIPGIDDGVGFHMLGHPEGKLEIAQFPHVRAPAW